MSNPAHAVVVSASMAGLLAARVLASHFQRVTVVERDHLPESPQTRKGVPQGRLLHVMLPCGQQIIERLFPGYSRELEAAGAVPLHMPADALVLTPAGWTGASLGGRCSRPAGRCSKEYCADGCASCRA